MSSDSQLLYHVKLCLQRHGHDVIKKLMSKDGHLVSEGVHYVRTRGKIRWGFAVWNSGYQVRDAHKYYNRHGQVDLDVVGWLEGGETLG